MVVLGDFLLRGTEAAVCQPDLFVHEARCLPGTQIQDMKDRSLRLFRLADYYPFLLIHKETNGATRHNYEHITSDSEALGRKVKYLRAQVVYLPSIPVKDRGLKRKRLVFHLCR